MDEKLHQVRVYELEKSTSGHQVKIGSSTFHTILSIIPSKNRRLKKIASSTFHTILSIIRSKNQKSPLKKSLLRLFRLF